MFEIIVGGETLTTIIRVAAAVMRTVQTVYRAAIPGFDKLPAFERTGGTSSLLVAAGMLGHRVSALRRSLDNADCNLCRTAVRLTPPGPSRAFPSSNLVCVAHVAAHDDDLTAKLEYLTADHNRSASNCAPRAS